MQIQTNDKKLTSNQILHTLIMAKFFKNMLQKPTVEWIIKSSFDLSQITLRGQGRPGQSATLIWVSRSAWPLCCHDNTSQVYLKLDTKHVSSLLDSPNEGHERKEKKTWTGRQGERGQKDRRQEDNVTFVPFRNPRLSEIPNC